MRRSAIIGAFCVFALGAQRSPEYDHSVVSQVRIDARDPGYPPVDRKTSPTVDPGRTIGVRMPQQKEFAG